MVRIYNENHKLVKTVKVKVVDIDMIIRNYPIGYTVEVVK